MTEPEDHSSTRPISVAELLARNGSIGAPPVGGRRRRKRGSSDSVTVAELTGEIPIVSESVSESVEANGDWAEASDDHQGSDLRADDSELPARPERTSSNGTVEHTDRFAVVQPGADLDRDLGEPDAPSDTDTDTDAVAVSEATAAAEADYSAHLEQRDADDHPVEFAAPTRRVPTFSGPVGGAEHMSPDPLIDDDDDDFGPDLGLIEPLDRDAPSGDRNGSELPSYLRSSSDTLFGGQSIADDIARRGLQPGPEDIDVGDDGAERADAVSVAESGGSPIVRGVWVVAQCILAVAFGAGLFVAFDLLWKWNNIVALVLSVLVILGLVVGVRVVRKTEDIGSTLIAVAVGALVTLGPLALLQSH